MSDFLIVGQGIAGSLLAWRLVQRGASVSLIDSGDAHAGSRVAPGVINPLAGRKLKPTWRVAEQLPVALAFYRELEQATGETFFHPTQIIRLIKDAKQRKELDQRLGEADAQAFIGEYHAPHTLGPAFRDEHGSIVTDRSGWVELDVLCRLLTEPVRAAGQLRAGVFDCAQLEVSESGVHYAGEAHGAVVFCEGWRGMHNSFLQHLPWNPARGEMLELRLKGEAFLPKHLQGAILNCGKWLLPLGGDRYRAGASYAWSEFDAPPTAEKREEILRVLGRFLDREFEVLGQVTGVRPVVEDYRPILGRVAPAGNEGLRPYGALRLPREEVEGWDDRVAGQNATESVGHEGTDSVPGKSLPLYVFNGLGSKGVLMGPWCSELMAAHLIDGQPLPEEVDVARFAG